MITETVDNFLISMTSSVKKQKLLNNELNLTLGVFILN